MRMTGCAVRSTEIYDTMPQILFILQQRRAVKSSDEGYEREVIGFV